MHIQKALANFVLQLDADGRSRHTIRQYQRHVAALQRWLVAEGHDGHVESINHEMLARFLTAPAARARPDGKAKKSGSMNALRTSLRCFFAYTDAAGIVPKNPARLVRRARCGPPLPRALSDADQKRLLEALAAADGIEARRDHALFALMLGTGVRLGSALALDVGDLDLEQGEILLRHAKGDREQRVVVNADVVAILRAFVGARRAGALFVRRDAERISVRHAQRRFAYWQSVAKVSRPVSPHGLRHSFAMRLYQSAQDVFVVKEALGHRSIASTMVYTSTPSRASWPLVPVTAG